MQSQQLDAKDNLVENQDNCSTAFLECWNQNIDPLLLALWTRAKGIGAEQLYRATAKLHCWDEEKINVLQVLVISLVTELLGNPIIWLTEYSSANDQQGTYIRFWCDLFGLEQ